MDLYEYELKSVITDFDLYSLLIHSGHIMAMCGEDREGFEYEIDMLEDRDLYFPTADQLWDEYVK